MKYLKKIGINARKAFNNLKDVKHDKIRLVLNNWSTSLYKLKNSISL